MKTKSTVLIAMMIAIIIALGFIPGIPFRVYSSPHYLAGIWVSC